MVAVALVVLPVCAFIAGLCWGELLHDTTVSDFMREWMRDDRDTAARRG